MKLHAMLKKILSLTAAVMACSVCLSVPAFAAVGGDLIYIDGSQVKGWAWDSDAPDTPQQVKIYGYADGSDQPYHFGTVTADMYSDGRKPPSVLPITDLPVRWSGIVIRGKASAWRPSS